MSAAQTESKRILVTGGTGYIGSHTVCGLLEAGYQCVVIDSFVNSSPESINRVKKDIVPQYADQVTVHKVDLCDYKGLEDFFRERGEV